MWYGILSGMLGVSYTFDQKRVRCLTRHRPMSEIKNANTWLQFHAWLVHKS